MNIEQALAVYNLPYKIVGKQEAPDFFLYELRSEGAGATLSRLKTRLQDIRNYTKSDISIIEDKGLFLREEKEHTTYLYTNYNGYIRSNPSMELPFMVGLTANECIIDDLTKAPHLLIAGTTGSGKSNYLHTLITSIICGKTPVCTHLIDCKQVEFTAYSKYANVVNDVDGAVRLLKNILFWMDDRYKKMKEAGVNNFKDYRRLNPDESYHVIVVDELADLINDKEAKKAIVPKLLRIAQIGRAGGFHLVIATQRPDSTVINGTLKGNIPTRICFNCASRIDSQIILDRTGAEHLTGNGDGLYLRNGSRDLVRFQATYLPLETVSEIMV